MRDPDSIDIDLEDGFDSSSTEKPRKKFSFGFPKRAKNKPNNEPEEAALNSVERANRAPSLDLMDMEDDISSSLENAAKSAEKPKKKFSFGLPKSTKKPSKEPEEAALNSVERANRAPSLDLMDMEDDFNSQISLSLENASQSAEKPKKKFSFGLPKPNKNKSAEEPEDIHIPLEPEEKAKKSAVSRPLLYLLGAVLLLGLGGLGLWMTTRPTDTVVVEQPVPVSPNEVVPPPTDNTTADVPTTSDAPIVRSNVVLQVYPIPFFTPTTRQGFIVNNNTTEIIQVTSQKTDGIANPFAPLNPVKPDSSTNSTPDTSGSGSTGTTVVSGGSGGLSGVSYTGGGGPGVEDLTRMLAGGGGGGGTTTPYVPVSNGGSSGSTPSGPVTKNPTQGTTPVNTKLTTSSPQPKPKPVLLASPAVSVPSSKTTAVKPISSTSTPPTGQGNKTTSPSPTTSISTGVATPAVNANLQALTNEVKPLSRVEGPSGASALRKQMADMALTLSSVVVGVNNVALFRMQDKSGTILVKEGQSIPGSNIVLRAVEKQQVILQLGEETAQLSIDRR